MPVFQNVDSQLRRQALECPYLHGDNDFTEELGKLAKSELNEDEETRVRCLEELRSRLKNEPGLLWQNDDPFLLAFLRSRKFDVDRAFSLVKGFYTSFGKYAHVYCNIDRDDIRRTLALNCMDFLPQRDSDGSSIIMFRMSHWDPKLASTEMLFAVGGLCILHTLRHNSTQVAGFKILLDYGGFSFKQLTCLRPWHMWLFGELLQNTFPFRMRGLHIVNQNNFFNTIWVIMRRFFSKKLTERIHFHFNDFKGLHQFVDPRILPAEYGGEQPSFDNSKLLQVLEKSEAYSEYVLSSGYEKYKRSFPGKKKWQRSTLAEDRTEEKI